MRYLLVRRAELQAGRAALSPTGNQPIPAASRNLAFLVSLDDSGTNPVSDRASKSPEASRAVRVASAVPMKVRIFISSTFRDMHAERELLAKYVFPTLRARCVLRDVAPLTSHASTAIARRRSAGTSRIGRMQARLCPHERTLRLLLAHHRRQPPQKKKPPRFLNLGGVLCRNRWMALSAATEGLSQRLFASRELLPWLCSPL